MRSYETRLYGDGSTAAGIRAEVTTTVVTS
jgi:hypothetical protein